MSGDNTWHGEIILRYSLA